MERYRDAGSAATLVGAQRILFLFVSDAGSEPWTCELRAPVVTKIEHSMRWLEHQANLSGVRLAFQHACAPREPVAAFGAGTHIPEGDWRLEAHLAWQDQVAACLAGPGTVAGRWDCLFDQSGLPLCGTDGSAILFLVRRRDSISSVAFPFSAGQSREQEKERAIVYDNGGGGGQTYLASVIAHEILHLYGAVDLRPETSDGSKLGDSSKLYSDDIMHTPNKRPLDQYCIADVTSYLVGWSRSRPPYLP